MKISIFTDKKSWMMNYLEDFTTYLENNNHEFNVYNDENSQGSQGDIAFFLSYFNIVKPEFLKKHRNNLVVHASELPKGRGWSPLTWQILEDKNEITVSLIEAEDKVDSGDIYIQDEIKFLGHELIDEMRGKIVESSFKLFRNFIENYEKILNNSKKQIGEATYYKKRGTKDSELDIEKSIKDQFNLLRTVDNKNYPAWFEILGHKYKLEIEKIDD